MAMLNHSVTCIIARSTLSCFMAFQGAASLRAEDTIPSYVPRGSLLYLQDTGTVTTSPLSNVSQDAAHTIATQFAEGVGPLPELSSASFPPYEITLAGEITEENAKKILNELDAISTISPKRQIILNIDSYGGLVEQGNLIRARLLQIPNRVDVVCTGEAKSMAAYLLLTHPAQKGERRVKGHCDIVTHAAYLKFPDGTHKKLDDADLTEDQKIRLLIIQRDFATDLSRISGRLSIEESMTYFEPADRPISVAEAQEMRLIDTVETDINPSDAGRGTSVFSDAKKYNSHSGTRIGEAFVFIAPTPAIRPGASELRPTLP